MKKALVLFCISFGLFISTFIFFSGCEDDSSSPGTPAAETVTTTISGTIFDQNQSPLIGVEVTAGTNTAITNSVGGFTFSNIQVPKSRFVVNAVKDGYFRGSYSDVPEANGSSNIEIYLVSAGVTEVINSSAGGTVEIENGTGVELASNSVVNSDGSAYSGDVNVSLAVRV